MNLVHRFHSRVVSVFVTSVLLAAGGCENSLTDPNRSIRDIGPSDKIADWALRQTYPGARVPALKVLFEQAMDTTPKSARDGEIAIYEYLRVLNSVEDLPPDSNVPFSTWDKPESKTTARDFAGYAYNFAAFCASESVGGTGVFFRIRPDARHAAFLPEWEHEHNSLLETWQSRQHVIERVYPANN